MSANGSKPASAKNRRTRRSLTGLTLSIAAAMGMILVGAQPASAAHKHQTGRWYQVCANSLTVHNNGPIGSLTWRDWFYIDHFGDGYNHAWGYSKEPYGWVYNGWFCSSP